KEPKLPLEGQAAGGTQGEPLSANVESIGRRSFLSAVGGALAGPAAIPAMARQAAPQYQIGAYYFPHWHADRSLEQIHGKRWTEWELLRRGEPRFAGHQQPKRPLWGYEDEADPAVFTRKIDAAADHALTHFLFDWYWYDDAPFLQRALEEG